MSDRRNQKPEYRAPSTTGAISELRVCADLLIKGYEVFRAVSPDASCDLIVMKRGVITRVQVRTTYRHPATNKLYACTNPADVGRQDMFAWVTPEDIVYDPFLPILSIS